MNRQIIFLVAGMLAMMMSSSSASGALAWWQLCDSCTSDSGFRYQALNAPGNYTPVYVTNRDTNETRKYTRWTSIEDFDGVLIQQTEVFEADFPAADKAVFEQAVQGSNIIFAQIPRNDLSGVIPGIVDQGSTAGDVSLGSLQTAYFTALRIEIERRNLLPTHESVNVEAGLDSPIVGANYGEGSTIRKRSLAIVVIYEDGSSVSMTRMPDGTLISISVLDADGNVIPVQGPPNGGTVPLAFDEFGGRDFGFGDTPGNRLAVEAFANAVNQGSGGSISCTWSPTASGGLVINCQRQN